MRPALFALALAAAFSATGAASACSCANRTLAQLLDDTDVVFTGRVEAIEARDNGLRRARIAVSETLKGRARANRDVLYEQGDGANCGWWFEPNQEVTVFASRYQGALYTGYCAYPRSREGIGLTGEALALLRQRRAR